MDPPISNGVFNTAQSLAPLSFLQGTLFLRKGGIIIHPAVIRHIIDTHKNIAALLISSPLFILTQQ